MHKDNCKTRRETFKFWDLVHLILKSWWYCSAWDDGTNIDAGTNLWHIIIYLIMALPCQSKRLFIVLLKKHLPMCLIWFSWFETWFVNCSGSQCQLFSTQITPVGGSWCPVAIPRQVISSHTWQWLKASLLAVLVGFRNNFQSFVNKCKQIQWVKLRPGSFRVYYINLPCGAKYL